VGRDLLYHAQQRFRKELVARLTQQAEEQLDPELGCGSGALQQNVVAGAFIEPEAAGKTCSRY
jgi:hypothetical protein